MLILNTIKLVFLNIYRRLKIKLQERTLKKLVKSKNSYNIRIRDDKYYFPPVNRPENISKVESPFNKDEIYEPIKIRSLRTCVAREQDRENGK